MGEWIGGSVFLLPSPHVALPPLMTLTSQSKPSKRPFPLVALVSWMDHCRPRRVCSASASLICGQQAGDGCGVMWMMCIK